MFHMQGFACQVDQKADNCVTWKDNGRGGWVFRLSQHVKRGRQHFLQALFLYSFRVLSTEKNRHQQRFEDGELQLASDLFSHAEVTELWAFAFDQCLLSTRAVGGEGLSPQLDFHGGFHCQTRLCRRRLGCPVVPSHIVTPKFVRQIG